MATTIIDFKVSKSTIDLLVSNDATRNSDTFSVIVTCKKGDPAPTKIVISSSQSGKVTTSIAEPKLNYNTDYYEYSYEVTVVAEDDVTATDVILTASIPNSYSDTVTISEIKTLPAWTIPTSCELIKTTTTLTGSFAISDLDEDLEKHVTITKSSPLSVSIDWRSQDQVSYSVDQPEQGQEDWITITSAGTDTYTSKSMTCNITYSEGNSTNLLISNQKNYEVGIRSSYSGPSISIPVTYNTGNTNTPTLAVDNPEFRAEDIISYSSKDKKITINPNNFPTIYTTTDITCTLSIDHTDTYLAESANLTITVTTDKSTQTWEIATPEYGTDHSIPYLATDDFIITLSKAVGAAGISTGEKTISESSNTLIVNRVSDNFSYIFSVKKTNTVTPGKVYCISIVSEADNTYNAKTVNFYVKFSESESEPKPLVNEATLLSDTKIWAHSNYKIKRECLPTWHPGYSVTGDIDLSEVLIYNNKISSHYISLEDNYFKTNDTGDHIYTYTDKDLPNSLNIGKYYKHGTDMDHNFFIAGANPGFGIVYDSKILVRYRYIQINKNEKCIKIFHDTDYSVPILDVTLTADNFRDKVFPIEFYLLICGKGGDAGKYKTLDNRNYHGVIGTAGSGAGNVLMKINLSKIYTSAAGVATITIENTEDNLTIYTNKADIATKYIKIGHGQNGVLITYDSLSGTIEDESDDYEVITGGTVDYNLPNGISMIMYNDGGDAKFTTTSVYNMPAETSQSIVIKLYDPYNSVFDGYYFPGGTFSGGAYTIKTDEYDKIILNGNGGGASGLAAGQTANHYNDIQDISTKYGAGSGAIDYRFYNPSSADIQKKQNVNSPGGPAYFAILY